MKLNPVSTIACPILCVKSTCYVVVKNLFSKLALAPVCHASGYNCERREIVACHAARIARSIVTRLARMRRARRPVAAAVRNSRSVPLALPKTRQRVHISRLLTTGDCEPGTACPASKRVVQITNITAVPFTIGVHHRRCPVPHCTRAEL